MPDTTRFRRWPVVVAALVGLVVGALGTVGLRPATRHTVAAPTTTVTATPAPHAPVNVATVQLLGSTSSADADINMTHDNRCFGRGPWSYLDAEAPVTVFDPVSGTVLARSQLSQGDLIDGACQFSFTVPPLPSMSQYGVRIVNATTVVAQVRIQTGLILRVGSCCAIPSSDPGGIV